MYASTRAQSSAVFGHVPAGKHTDAPAMTIDVLPTLAKLTGAKLPKHKIDGLDIWPVLSGQPGAKSPHEAYFFYWNRELQGVRRATLRLSGPMLALAKAK